MRVWMDKDGELALVEESKLLLFDDIALDGYFLLYENGCGFITQFHKSSFEDLGEL